MIRPNSKADAKKFLPVCKNISSKKQTPLPPLPKELREVRKNLTSTNKAKIPLKKEDLLKVIYLEFKLRYYFLYQRKVVQFHQLLLHLL